jgi:hypothetical protein
MITQEQQANRDKLLNVMHRVIDNNLLFDIHHVELCPLHYYRNFTDLDKAFPIFDNYICSNLFYLPEGTCVDLFALSSWGHKGDADKFCNATYHLDRIINAFKENV